MRIGILTVIYIKNDKQLNLAIESLESLKSEHELYQLGVVNFCSPDYLDKLKPYYDDVIYNDENCLARAWNVGIKHLFNLDCDYVIVPNLDIHARQDTIDVLVEDTKHEGIMWVGTDVESIVSHGGGVAYDLTNNSFSFYMIDRNLLNKVGEFDERYKPAYFEDWDMIMRIQHEGYKIVRSKGAVYLHYEGACKRLDEGMAHLVNVSYSRNREIYEKKKKKLAKRKKCL